jgi:[ribosomal protein S5]-alanine N-acetyltransferase
MLKLVEIDAECQLTDEVPSLSPFAQEVCTSILQLYQAKGFVRPWIGYLVLRGTEIVGTCAFKGPPQHNQVEIAYFTFPEFEAQGLATAMAQRLVQLALQVEPNLCVSARTLPESNASTAVLRKAGFMLMGTVDDPEDGEVWQWIYSNPLPASANE